MLTNHHLLQIMLVIGFLRLSRNGFRQLHSINLNAMVQDHAGKTLAWFKITQGKRWHRSRSRKEYVGIVRGWILSLGLCEAFCH
jgi:hypothetical protein